jgi:hypothetical protein
MPEPSSNGFVMHGSRAVLAAFGSALHIEHQIISIERAVHETPALAFDLAKALIETICRTILQDRARPYEATWDMNRLFKETVQCLRLVPDAHTSTPEIRQSLQRTLSGMYGLIQGLCELRNQVGIASHGHDAFDEPMEPVQALLAARTADALVHYLFSVHRNYARDPNVGRVRYVDFDDFNEFVDQTNEPVQVLDLVFKPSETLFYVDEDAYRAKLAEYQTDEDQQDAEDQTQPQTPPPPAPNPAAN